MALLNISRDCEPIVSARALYGFLTNSRNKTNFSSWAKRNILDNKAVREYEDYELVVSVHYPHGIEKFYTNYALTLTFAEVICMYSRCSRDRKEQAHGYLIQCKKEFKAELQKFGEEIQKIECTSQRASQRARAWIEEEEKRRDQLMSIK